MKRILLNIILIFLTCSNLFSQNFLTNSTSVTLPGKNKSLNPQTSYTSLSLGLAAILYVINPIILMDDKKIYAGFTKEISAGFGKMGQHRFGFEYSFIFTGNVSHHFRLSYKYDFLLKQDVEPSHLLQGTAVLSTGAGYFSNFHKNGFFPEVTLGYSIRNHKILIFPHIKLRHTFMIRKIDTDISDFSFGIMFGFANPFIDVNIKREY